MNKAVGFVPASLHNSAYCKEEKSLSRQVMGGKHTAIRLLASRPPRWTTFLTILRAFSKCPQVHASGLFVDNEMAFKRPAPGRSLAASIFLASCSRPFYFAHHIDPMGHAAGPEAVVDIHHPDPRCAGIQHGQ